MKFHKTSLRSILLDYIKIFKVLDRKEVWKIAMDNGYTESNAERRMKELVETYGIKRFTMKGNKVKGSKFIGYWKW